MMKTRISLAVLALSLSACTATVAQRDADHSGQALVRDTITAGDCERKSRRFWNRADITFGGIDTTTAAIDRDTQRRLYWDCIKEREHQAP